jgi:SAM-dependent methyltransferase
MTERRCKAPLHHAHEQRRRPGTGQVQRAGPPLVGPRERVPPAARDQPAAAGLDRPAGAVRGKRCSTSAAAAASWPRRWRARRRRARHRPGDQAAGRGAAARAGVRRAEPRLPRGGAEALAAEQPGAFDVVTCMEMLEHVPDPASTVRACAALVKPGGWVFFSTINRNPKAFLFAIVGAEYVLKLLPKGTHEYARFIRPSELARHGRDAGLDLRRHAGHDLQPADAPLPLEPTPASTTWWPAASAAADALRRRAVRPGRHPGRQRARPGRCRQRPARPARPAAAALRRLRPMAGAARAAWWAPALVSGRDDDYDAARRFLACTSAAAARPAPCSTPCPAAAGASSRGRPWGMVTNKASVWPTRCWSRAGPRGAAPPWWWVATARRTPSRTRRRCCMPRRHWASPGALRVRGRRRCATCRPAAPPAWHVAAAWGYLGVGSRRATGAPTMWSKSRSSS